ncbi:transporter substrate-binding domain-containing protein [Endozoicomonas sp. SM1973]|uniref:Transporter substrate-binding domain-containing protein n=1 Tax=Spartinivicinus marinus TaxID=2994442 RepID=A0A853I644_9GAMM|nr:transporter substrate-binding domain-containing protein [Spartinivicinus marinus]MCX4027546.1 transporter substrate-binding domain-containing protein [Spartinivicinus marinus]NYZ68209.1 transporter substrate-binding domain-containing protein [Spartinivicinus marinus]
MIRSSLCVVTFCLIFFGITEQTSSQEQLAQTQSVKQLSVATLVGYPPFIIAKRNLRAAHYEVVPPGLDSDSIMGYSWDVFRGSFHQQGYTINLKVYPWVRAIEEVKKQKVDLLFPAGWTKDRSEYLLYSKRSINKVDFLIYVNQTSSIQWNGLQGLKKLRIGLMRGWSYGEQWADLNNVKKIPVNDILQGFRMLDNNRIDGFAGYFPVFDYTLNKVNKSTQYRKLPAFDSTYEFVVSAINNPRANELITAFDKGMKALAKSGVLEKAKRTWLYDMPVESSRNKQESQ